MAYLKDRPKKSNGKIYHNYVIAETKRDANERKNKTVIIKKLGNIDDDIAYIIKRQLAWEKLISTKDIVEEKSLSYWAINLIIEKAKQLKLDRILGIHFDRVVCMIANRIIDPMSKLACKKRAETTYLTEKDESYDEDNFYNDLEYLQENQKSIEDKLYKNYGKRPTFVMYDITSTYVRWDKCPLAKYWHSRDNMPWNKQIVIWLLVDEFGYPLAVEVFNGNTPDTKTVEAKILELKTRFWLEEVIVVVDRWMNVEYNLNKATKNNTDLDLSHFSYITACKKPEIQKLMWKYNPVWLFDTETYTEIVDKEEGKRYVVMYNKLRIDSDKQIRLNGIEKITKKLDKLEEQTQNWKIKTRDALIKKIGQIETFSFAKKCFSIVISDDNKPEFTYNLLDKEIENLAKFDGLYVLVTNIIDKEKISKDEIVSIYKQKDVVEKAFEVIKWDLSIHPLYHHLEKRVKWHVLVCFLAYLMEHLLKKDWSKILEKESFKSCLLELSKVTYFIQYIQITKNEKKKLTRVIWRTKQAKELYNMAWVVST